MLRRSWLEEPRNASRSPESIAHRGFDACGSAVDRAILFCACVLALKIVAGYSVPVIVNVIRPLVPLIRTLRLIAMICDGARPVSSRPSEAKETVPKLVSTLSFAPAARPEIVTVPEPPRASVRSLLEASSRRAPDPSVVTRAPPAMPVTVRTVVAELLTSLKPLPLRL